MIRRALLVAAFAALLVLPPLGQRVIMSGDEARFAVLAQDMLRRSTWFDARVRDQRYRNKPLLYPWAIKVLSLPQGRVTQTTAQLPIALAAIGGVFFTALLGQQLVSARAGVFAGLVLSTSYAYFAHSQILLPDMLVVAFGLAALCAFWAAVNRPPGRAGTLALAAFYAAVALGVAAKGPMGLVPALIVVVWLLTEKGVAGLRRLVSPLGGFAFVVVSAAWLLPYLFAGSRSFAHGVVWEDWLAWYLGIPQPHKIANKLLDLAKGSIPWTTLLALPLLDARREWRDGAFRFALLAWVVPLVVVLLSNNHRARYLLPTYPAAALLVAWWADRGIPERSRAVHVVATATVAGALVAVAVLALPWVDPAERALVDGFWWKAGSIASGALGLSVFAAWALCAQRPGALVTGTALGMAVLLGCGVSVYNGWVNRGQNYPVLASVVERHARGGDVAVTGGRFFSIDFYLGRGLTPARTPATLDAWLARPDRPVSVVTGRAWGFMRGLVRSEVEVLDTMRVRKHVILVVRAADPASRRP
ncbi:MAG TPA: glycosyltransferase family 39 protein [Methylomirabilota bacterium]|nr:glycosyltransferase family 39 protein [Methylomirabilota bacterium]